MSTVFNKKPDLKKFNKKIGCLIFIRKKIVIQELGLFNKRLQKILGKILGFEKSIL